MKYDEALEKLKHTELGIDLTGINVQKMKDKKAKKVLEPLLQKVLPRRKKGIEHSSYYRALRVKLLPDNLYFRSNIAIVRQLFHIPEGQIADIDLTQFPSRHEPWDKEDILRADYAASCWLRIHRHTYAKVELGDIFPPLPQWLTDSANTMLEFGENAPLDWLKKHPKIPNSYAARFDLSLPIDFCVARLIERYQLPWQCDYKLRFFLLTEDCSYLKNIYPFDVMIDLVKAPIGEAYRVTVDGVDEYTTREQWDDIYENLIKLRQDLFWEMRGDLPHSRQIDLDNLMKPVHLELLKIMATQPKIGIDTALELLSRKEKLPADGFDRTTAYRVIKKSNVLMKPLD